MTTRHAKPPIGSYQDLLDNPEIHRIAENASRSPSVPDVND